MSWVSVPALRPEDLLWIFGFGRSGSTWLARMLGHRPGTEVWHEPMIGQVFGAALDPTQPYTRGPAFVLGGPPRHRVPPVRAFVLAAIAARYPTLRAGNTLVLKEQNASIGAPILCEALPESRCLLLVRDPRDVIASVKDAVMTPGSWAHRQFGTSPPESFELETWVAAYAASMAAATRAFDVHGGPKASVRYEDLRADPLATLRATCAGLAWPCDEGILAEAVAAHAWESLPGSAKGPGEFYREATPGGWRRSLVPADVSIVESGTSEVLRRFYDG